MNVVEFFDVNNDEHLQAWAHLERVGTWPKGFLPASIEMPPVWATGIAFKMADAWIAAKLSSEE